MILCPLLMMGQMFPLSDQYLNNTLAINPAFAGCQDALSATVLYRNQWVGFKDAPKDLMLSVHTPYFNDKVGLGLLIEKSSIGIYNETSFIGNYAYRMELNNGILALGLGFGTTIYNVAWNELKATDEGDVQLMNTPQSAVLPDFSLGAYYYNQKYFIGISIPRFLSHELNHYTGKYKIKTRFYDFNYFITGGHFFDLSPRIKLLPSILVKYNPGHIPQTDYNAQIILSDRIWFGIGYRNKNMLMGMFKCQLNDQLLLSYSHDFDLGPISRYNSGSHEILLNYVFSYSRVVAGPRQF